MRPPSAQLWPTHEIPDTPVAASRRDAPLPATHRNVTRQSEGGRSSISENRPTQRRCKTRSKPAPAAGPLCHPRRRRDYERRAERALARLRRPSTSLECAISIRQHRPSMSFIGKLDCWLCWSGPWLPYHDDPGLAQRPPRSWRPSRKGLTVNSFLAQRDRDRAPSPPRSGCLGPAFVSIRFFA